MESPIAHHHHDGEKEEEQPKPCPPPSHHPNEYPPAPLPAYGQPGYSSVQHDSHQSDPENGPPPPAPNQPYTGEPTQDAHHENYGSLASVQRHPTVRIFTKAEENYSLSIRDGQVILAPANPRDEYQHWIKDLKFSTQVQDEEGFPSFALVNKVTGQAIKHSIGATHPVRLVQYNPDYLDESVLWSEGKDTGEGFRCIRMVNNIRLNFDAFHGDENHGGVRDGTTVVLWEWLEGKNQSWKIAHYCPDSLASVLRQPTVRVFTKADENYSLSVGDGQVVLAPANPRDEYQHWIKDLKFSTQVQDEEGFPSFALVNKVTGQAIKHSIGATHPVRLVSYNPDYLDESVLWSEGKDTGEGFRCIRMVNDIGLNLDAFHGDEDHGGVRDGTTVVLWEWQEGKNQRWKTAPYRTHSFPQETMLCACALLLAFLAYILSRI